MVSFWFLPSCSFLPALLAHPSPQHSIPRPFSFLHSSSQPSSPLLFFFFLSLPLPSLPPSLPQPLTVSPYPVLPSLASGRLFLKLSHFLFLPFPCITISNLIFHNHDNHQHSCSPSISVLPFYPLRHFSPFLYVLPLPSVCLLCFSSRLASPRLALPCLASPPCLVLFCFPFIKLSFWIPLGRI